MGSTSSEGPAQGAQHRAQDERDEQQEADPEDHRERQESVLDQAPDSAPRLRLDLPDRVHRILQLAEDARRGDQQGHHADDAGEDPPAGLLGIGEHLLDRPGPLLADELPDLRVELPRGRLLAEDQAGDRDGDDQQRRQREHAVEGQGRAQLRDLVPQPFRARGLQDRPVAGDIHRLSLFVCRGRPVGLRLVPIDAEASGQMPCRSAVRESGDDGRSTRSAVTLRIRQSFQIPKAGPAYAPVA